ILSWALANPAKASVVEAEQLQLPALEAANGTATTAAHVALDVLDRFELVRPKPSASVTAPDAELELSFSQLHDYEICPVRYRFSQVWGVPAPPDELLNRAARAASSTELGAAVHTALAAWHAGGGDLLSLYTGPDAGRPMLERYRDHPLASVSTLGVESRPSQRASQPAISLSVRSMRTAPASCVRTARSAKTLASINREREPGA